MKIAIIGGGNMGGAIAKGMARGSFVKASDITVADLSNESLEKIKGYDPAIRTTKDNIEAVSGADIVIVAVKPWLLEEVVNGIKGGLDYSRQAFMSIVAGVSFGAMKKMLDRGDGTYPAMYRTIPNTAISVGESVNFIASEGAGREQVEDVLNIFGELGYTLEVREDMMGAGTSLASCGIAFALKYIDASIRGGVLDGFGEKEARGIVMQTVKGALAVLEAGGTMPQTEIDRVTTPGGVTLKGLKAMADAGFEEAVIAGIRESK